MRKRLALVVLVTLLIGILVSGCSKADPLEAYKQAGIKANAAKTSHQVAKVTSSAGGMSVNITTDMVVDAGKNLASGKFVMEVPGMGGALNFDAYMVDGHMYMQAPGLDKYIAYPSDFGDLYRNIDPNEISQLIAANSKPAIAKASFTVNGRQVNGQKVDLVIDTAKMKASQSAKLEKASEETKKLMADSIAAFDSMGATIPMTAYIDADGYLSRIEMTIKVTQSGTTADVKTIVEVFDFGKTVDIQVPTFTAENTISFDELMGALQNMPQ